MAAPQTRRPATKAKDFDEFEDDGTDFVAEEAIDESDDDDDFMQEFEENVISGTGSAFPRMDDLNGCTLYITPLKEGTRQSQQKGQTGDYVWVECHVVVLRLPEDGWPVRRRATEAFFEGEDVPMELDAFQFTGQSVTPRLQLALNKDKSVLGVLVRMGDDSNSPWRLEPFDETDKALAVDYMKMKRAAERSKGRGGRNPFAGKR